MKYSVMLLYTCALVAMVNGHWKNKGTGKCRVQSESKTGKSPSWEWVDCVYSNGDLIMISTTKRPTTTQKPLKIEGQFKKRGPGKCLVKSETEKTKKGNQPAWVWVDCDYSSGRPKPITSNPPVVKTTAMPTTVRPVVPVPPPVPNPVRPQIPVQIPARPPMQVPAQVRPPMQVPAQVRPPMQVPAQVRPPMQVPVHVRPPMQVPPQVRPPAQVPPQVRPSTPVYFPAWPSVQVPSRPPPVPAPFPVQSPVPAPVPPRPLITPTPTPARPPMSAPTTPRSVPVATTRKTSLTTPSNEICKGRWCWNGTIWVDKGKPSTEKTLNIFKKPTLP
ncbi:repetitive proline-rich cell wall protein 2 isoform X2 [Daphnia magna]|uniref:repetitive proline-rich cell wall protein 2 isoform X2 n=1 Tax=Daphnia magna TaxID=35525 RepID=UPI001E1BDD83|nr:repetitive proline-rich cell wall protein 2 isoform X2 [Daphnia magna]